MPQKAEHSYSGSGCIFPSIIVSLWPFGHLNLFDSPISAIVVYDKSISSVDSGFSKFALSVAKLYS